MDRQQFDALSRRFAHLVGRRSILHVAAFGPMVAGLAVAGDGDAKRKRKKKKGIKGYTGPKRRRKR